jgi:acetoin utilization deacetylase AcuC-like enzyme
MMIQFAVYLHPEIEQTTKPPDQIRFVGHGYHHFCEVRAQIAAAVGDTYPSLPLRQADAERYTTVHDTAYVGVIRRLAAGQPVDKGELPSWSAENTGLQYCWPGYLYSLGGLMAAVDAMKAGSLDRAYCYTLAGHHAFANRGHGYCILNPMAAAARYAQSVGFAKMLIVDWDIHHGDGTQTIFAHDPSVYHISIHSVADLYMMLARSKDLGTTTTAEQVGHCNVPLLDAFFPDHYFERIHLTGRYYRAAESKPAFRAALDTVPWSPDLIMIFAGVDSHKDDCGKGITEWDNTDFQELVRWVLDLAARESCPVLMTSGGGYQLPVTVAANLSQIEALAAI